MEASPDARESGSSGILDRIPLRFVVGTTASGKSGLALRLARHPRVLSAGGVELVSLDSMNLYRGMDIGTAKPAAADLAAVPHHLVDVAEPSERFDLQRYLGLVESACLEIESKGRSPLFVGGTGLYLASILRGLFQGPPADHDLRERLRLESESGAKPSLHERLRAVDPDSAERIHSNDTRRTLRALEVWHQTGVTMTALQQEWRAETSPRETRARIVGLDVDVERLDERIRSRTDAMLDAGWAEEALRLESAGGLGPSASQALGYDTALLLGRGELTREEAAQAIALRTRQFARRQRTWYRKFDVRWIDAAADDVLDLALEALDFS
ncbi:MAG: tRNA (adenosine(37)-N6)-dimethylallyltransferase MiaA [Planctomycetota bacterium]